MKGKIFIGLIILLFFYFGYRGYRMSTTRSHSPLQTIHVSYDDLDINVIYCSPSKKDRVIFGEAKHRAWLPDGKFWTVAFRILTGLPPTSGALVPYGAYWRLGANDATEISFTKNVYFASMPVNAGRYRMYAIPDASTWQIALSSELGKFGYHEPNYALDVVKIQIPVKMAPFETEKFTISFDTDSSGVKMNFIWDKTLVCVPITLQ